MTTWHGQDSLEHAIEFLLLYAWPDDYFAETCQISLVVVVADADLAEQARGLLQRSA